MSADKVAILFAILCILLNFCSHDSSLQFTDRSTTSTCDDICSLVIWKVKVCTLKLANDFPLILSVQKEQHHKRQLTVELAHSIQKAKERRLPNYIAIA